MNRMEKLIYLLNEYDKIKWDKEEPIYNWKIAIKTKIYQTYLISARYWFIKRLVEKEKIDTDAYKTVYTGDLDKRRTLFESRDGEEIYQVTEHWVYESLIMLLSISDTPIEDLISYLR